MATRNGTAGNDVFVAHTDADYLKGSLTFVLGATPAQGGWPTPNILINGQPVAANVLVNSHVVQGHTQVVSVPLPSGPITSVGLHFWNDLVIPGGEDRNLYVGSVTLNGTTLNLASGVYDMDDYPTSAGRHDMNWNGTMVWSGAQITNAMASGTVAESHVFDGGAGVDTVTYKGKEREYVVRHTHDDAITVSSPGAKFSDALWNVENVLFDDNSAYGAGWDAVIDAVNGTIDGGRGLDTLVLKGSRSEYFIDATTTGFSISGNGVNQWVTNVERLKFEDGYVALDIEGHGGMAYRLYQAAFDRVPDVPGVGYQTNELDTKLTLVQVAANFIASPEFQRTYGNVDDRQFVTLLYRNVLDREPEQAGLEYHMNRLASGATRADVLVGFSESPENKANVIGQIQDGFFYTLG